MHVQLGIQKIVYILTYIIDFTILHTYVCIFVTRLDKGQLPHTQWQDWLFTTTRFPHQLTNNPCVYHCQLLPWSAFPGACFLSLFGMLKCSGGLGVTGQAPTWLEITTRLARKLGHWIGYYLWYLELEWASGETIWQCQLLHVEKPATFMVPHHSWPPPLNIWSFVIVV